jgi:hypothetical protein
MRIVAMLANLMIHYLIVKMIVVNSAQNAMRALGRMKRLWHNVRPTWYYWILQKRRKYNGIIL